MSDPAKSKSVLLVDDDRDVLEVTKLFFQMEGFQVLTADNGLAFIQSVQQGCPHAVFLDLGLPDMDGLEALKQVRALQPGLPVIVVTGCHEESRGRQAIELGAWDYVTKPVDLKYLKNMLLSCLTESD